MSAYLEQLAEWKRDSAVIDSLSRLINIDSLIQLRRATLRAGTERPFRHAGLCESHRMAWRHGLRPTMLADNRVDSAFTPEELRRFDQIRAATAGGLYEVGDSVCGPMGAPAPKEVGGVSLNVDRIRPLHPDSTMPPR
jgi:hypothetical protein